MESIIRGLNTQALFVSLRILICLYLFHVYYVIIAIAVKRVADIVRICHISRKIMSYCIVPTFIMHSTIHV